MDENVIVEDTGTEMSGILLKDHTGTPVEYELPQKLRVDTTDGGTALYVHESQVAEPVETTVALDFSGGGMTVTPEEGKVFSKVSIPVPEGLIPANIAEGVKIAGIIGAFKGGGGALVKYGSFTTPSTFKAGNRISVDIGFKPEILIVLRKSGVTEGKGTIYLGLSNAFAGVCGTAYMTTVIWKDTYSTYSASYTTGIDTTLTGNFIYNADETGFNFGGSYPPAPSTAYSYVAIG